VRLVDGTRLNLHCVPADEFAVALWRATGSPEHVREIEQHAKARGLTVAGNRLLDAKRTPKPIASEADFYAALGLPYVEPELREGLGEVRAAIDNALPALITADDIRGVLHCHTQYSDGSASIRDMVAAAQTHGWSYLGISDHSRAAAYAGGLSTEAVYAQHAEIDRINDELRGASRDFRVLKGIEADILIDGRLDYEPASGSRC
jgi:DNA polymerase (family X)